MWYLEVEYGNGANFMTFYDTRAEARTERHNIYQSARIPG